MYRCSQWFGYVLGKIALYIYIFNVLINNFQLNELPQAFNSIRREDFPFIKTYAAAEAAHFRANGIAESLDQVNHKRAKYYSRFPEAE